jgi:hypothetical protein
MFDQGPDQEIGIELFGGGIVAGGENYAVIGETGASDYEGVDATPFPENWNRFLAEHSLATN